MASLNTVEGSMSETIATRIREALDGAAVSVEGGGGHFTIEVVWDGFAGKAPLACQRLVYSAIAPLMSGDSAPVHAVDRLVTRTE